MEALSRLPVGVVILGGGGHGRDILHSLRADGVPVAGVYDSRPDRATLGDTTDWRNDPRPFLVGVNDPQVRAELTRSHTGKPYNHGIWVHPDASIGPNVDLGEGTHVNAGATITRSKISRFCTVSPGANICGDVTVGSFCQIGAGAVLCEFVWLNSDVVVGAGTVVPPYEHLWAGTWVGVPAECVETR